MPTESQTMEKVHEIDREQGQHEVRIRNLESWVNDIHKTLKSVELKVTLAGGAFLAIEFFFKIWGK
jgi:hypothetical protein